MWHAWGGSNIEEIFDWETGRKEYIQKACVNKGG